MATPSNCLEVLLNYQYRSTPERRWLHHGESRGYGKNLVGRDNGQPSPKGLYEVYGCSSQTKWGWVMSTLLQELVLLKI